MEEKESLFTENDSETKEKDFDESVSEEAENAFEDEEVSELSGDKDEDFTEEKEDENFDCENDSEDEDKSETVVFGYTENVSEEKSEEKKEENPFIKIEESSEYKKLEKEYKEYRQKKVLSHIDALILPNMSQNDIKQEFAEVVRAEKGSVCVLPQTLKQAKKELPQIIKVSVLINYPFAGSEKSTVFAEIKTAARAKANSAVVCMNLSSFLSGNSKIIDKDLKALKKFGSKIKVVPLFPAQGLSLEQASKLAALVKVNMITRVGIALDPLAPNVDKAADVIKIFYNVLGEQCPVDAYGSICSAEAAETLFNADADRVVTAEYRALSRQKLDGVEVK